MVYVICQKQGDFGKAFKFIVGTKEESNNTKKEADEDCFGEIPSANCQKKSQPMHMCFS